MIIAQEVNQTIDPDSISAIKKNIRKSNRQRQVQLAVNAYDQLPPQLKRCVDLANGQRVREVEHGVFTPLVFSSTGGMGREAITFYKRLADMLSQKRQHPYPTVMGWLRCRLSFASLRSSIMCIRGSRSSLHRPSYGTDITLAASEGRVPAL